MHLKKILARGATRIILRVTVNSCCSAANPDALFKKSWNRLQYNRLYIWLMCHAFPQNSYSYVPIESEIYKQLASYIPGFYRHVSIRLTAALKEAIALDEPFMVIQVHQGHRFLSKVLSETKRNVVRLASNPAGYLKRLKTLGIESTNLTVIRNDLLSLARIRSFISSKSVICCAIDHRDLSGPKNFVSPSLPDFAVRMRMPVYFAKVHITSHGDAEILSSGPHHESSGEQLAKLFIDFHNSQPGVKIDLIVKTPTRRARSGI